MKINRMQIATGILSACMTLSCISTPIVLGDSITPLSPNIVSSYTSDSRAKADRQSITDFVTRLYNICLDRDADSQGLDYWVNQLETRQATGVSVSYGFVFSPEFQGKQCNKTQYVTFMYKAFFGREPEDSGLKYWVEEMKNGLSREAVFAGFSNSAEFEAICNSYGVVRGDYLVGKSIDQVSKINLFVDRLYKNTLDRACDSAGMTYWTMELLNGRLTGSEAAAGFIFSDEFKDRNLCNQCYIEVLYRSFMGREADVGGLDYWWDELVSGTTRESAFNGFVASPEFTEICNSYGIVRGEPSLAGNTLQKQNCSVCGARPQEIDYSAMLTNYYFNKIVPERGVAPSSKAFSGMHRFTEWIDSQGNSHYAAGVNVIDGITGVFGKLVADFDKDGIPELVVLSIDEINLPEAGRNKKFFNKIDVYSIVDGTVQLTDSMNFRTYTNDDFYSSFKEDTPDISSFAFSSPQTNTVMSFFYVEGALRNTLVIEKDEWSNGFLGNGSYYDITALTIKNGKLIYSKVLSQDGWGSDGCTSTLYSFSNGVERESLRKRYDPYEMNGMSRYDSAVKSFNFTNKKAFAIVELTTTEWESEGKGGELTFYAWSEK